MYTYLDEIAKTERKRWNGKVITTGNQWLFNDGGSAECASAHLSGVIEAIAEAGVYSYCEREVEERLYRLF